MRAGNSGLGMLPWECCSGDPDLGVADTLAWAAPASLEVSKARLDGAWSSLRW